MSTEQKKLELLRYYPGLDTLRASMMLIGVVWHSSLIIRPNFIWIYNSKAHESFSIFSVLYSETLFRMHAFFLVSGFLAQRVLMSRDKITFSIMRIKRILMPLLLGCAMINLITFEIQVDYLHKKEWSELKSIGFLIKHGWFLVVLFWFAIIDVLLPKKFFTNRVVNHPIFITLLMVICGIGPRYLDVMNSQYWHLSEPVALWFNLFVVSGLMYYPYYFLGGLLFHNQRWIEYIKTKHLWLIGIVAYISVMLVTLRDIDVSDAFYYFPFSAYSYDLTKIAGALSISFLLFYVFYKQIKNNIPLINYLIKASIVVYLVHILIGVLFAVLLDKIPMNTLTYFILLVILTTIASFLFYEIIRRFKWLRFAFGLKDNAAPKLS